MTDRRDFTLPDACERYEVVRFPLDTPLQETPAIGASQKKEHVFQINDRAGVYDFSKGYFDIKFRMEKKDGTGTYPTADNITMVNGVHSLIRRLTIKTQDGLILYQADDVNQIIHVKKLLEMSKDYAETVAENEFYYIDDTTTYTSTGFLARKELLVNDDPAENMDVNYKIPLSWFSIFAEMNFNNVLLSGITMRITVEIEKDENLIYSAIGIDAGRVILSRFDLFVPQLTFRPEYHARYINSITTGTPIRWTYLHERIESYGPTSLQSGVFKIPNTVNPRKVIFFWLNSTKEDSQFYNKQFFDSLFPNPANNNAICDTPGCHLERARLEVGSGHYYPESEYIPKDEIARIYGDVIRYSHADDDRSAGILLSRTLFKNLYSMLYFDLDYKKAPLVSDNTDLTLTYKLTSKPGDDAGVPRTYRVYAIILGEYEASYVKKNDSFTLISEVSAKPNF